MEERRFNQEHETNNNVKTVIHYLGINAVLLVAGVIWSSFTGIPLDAGLTGLAGTAIGYLGGLFKNANAPTPTQRSGGSVTIDNTTANPIPTDQVEAEVKPDGK